MEQHDIEASSRLELDDGTVITRCDQCRTMHSERRPPTIPPCVTCRVDLMPENEDAVSVYLMCRGQVITRGIEGHIVDISIPAIKDTMDAYGVKDQKKCLGQVRSLFFHFLEKE